MSMKEDITPRNDKGQKHGLHILYWFNGIIDSRRRWVNGNLNGICEEYWETGNLHSKTNYKNGRCLYGEGYGITNRIMFWV